MQFANDGVGNDAGPVRTTLKSTNLNSTLFIENGNGIAVNASGNGGVRGNGTNDSAGVSGINRASGPGVDGRSARQNGVQGHSESPGGSGVFAQNLSGGGYGLWARISSGGAGGGIAVFAENYNAGGLTGVFNGRVLVTGALSKLGGGFKMDHPQAPADRYLTHCYTESPNPMNIYDGNVTTGEDGVAIIELPGYFEALNRDFRYQLTVLGGEFAQAVVAEEVRNNRFSIRTDKPGVRVSWQVTGIRQDAWANAHLSEFEVEVDKTDDERGRYLSPVEHGMPASAGLFYTEPSASEENSTGMGEQG
jgi:hypothetical protein